MPRLGGWRGTRVLALSLVLLWPAMAWAAEDDVIRVGSKKFTESVLLGDMIHLLVESTGRPAKHQRELGGTRILWGALLAGELDVYAEYTGTLLREILVNEDIADLDELRDSLAAKGLKMTGSLGFNNTYAMATTPEIASERGLRTISDLRKHPDLVLGFGNEFMDRSDGWPGLKAFYGLTQTDVRGLDHDLAYRGIASGMLQLTDAYSTDAEIDY